MEIITNSNNKYELITNHKNGFDKDDFISKCTDYFDEYDYIVGDIAYNKLRLKGFYDSTNPKVKALNDYKNLDKYLKENCANDCKYFVLKKLQ